VGLAERRLLLVQLAGERLHHLAGTRWVTRRVGKVGGKVGEKVGDKVDDEHVT
jgi:hypothetical protein